jgi:Uma2 family endonuclease
METLILKTGALSLTEEEFFNFCQQNRELRFEKDKEQNILIMSPTGSLSGYYNSIINSLLASWNLKTRLGFTFDSNSGFTLPNGSMRSPDAAWIKRERYLGIDLKDRKKFTHICPDFIIELKSETDSLKQLKLKMDEWLENGCRLAWLIDFEERKTYVYKPGQDVSEILFNEKLTGEDVLPGFVMDFAFVDEI